MSDNKSILLSTYLTDGYPKLLCPHCKVGIKTFYRLQNDLCDSTLFNSIGHCHECDHDFIAMDLIRENSPEKNKEITIQRLEVLLDKKILSYTWEAVIRNAIDLIKGST